MNEHNMLSTLQTLKCLSKHLLIIGPYIKKFKSQVKHPALKKDPKSIVER